MKIFLVAGARPNFMKIAPIAHAFNRINETNQIDYKVVHTGQHYDYQMSQSFFDELEIKRPDYFLGVGSASHAIQTAKIMVALFRIEDPSRADGLEFAHYRRRVVMGHDVKRANRARKRSL